MRRVVACPASLLSRPGDDGWTGMEQLGRSLESRAEMGRSRIMAVARAVFGRMDPPAQLRTRLTQARERELELEMMLRESERRRAEFEVRLERFGRLSGAVAH